MMAKYAQRCLKTTQSHCLFSPWHDSHRCSTQMVSGKCSRSTIPLIESSQWHHLSGFPKATTCVLFWGGRFSRVPCLPTANRIQCSILWDSSSWRSHSTAGDVMRYWNGFHFMLPFLIDCSRAFLSAQVNKIGFQSSRLDHINFCDALGSNFWCENVGERAWTY